MAETGTGDFASFFPPVAALPQTPILSQEALNDLEAQLASGQLSSVDMRRILSQLALRLLPSRAAGIQESFLQQQRLAAGSPQETLLHFNDQINTIQQQLRTTSQTIARQGGVGAGGQRQRLQAQALQQAARQLQGITGEAVGAGHAGLLRLASGILPSTAVQIPPARESITTQPFTQYDQLGGASVALARQLRDLLRSSNTTPALTTSSSLQYPGLEVQTPAPVFSTSLAPAAPSFAPSFGGDLI